jgi:hypothetical protein
MPRLSARTLRYALTAAGALVFAGLGASPASASVCPPGYTNPDPLYTGNPYCYPAGSGAFATLMLASGPEAWYRLGDPAGAQVMLDSSGNGFNGEYKNGQESGPVGISADNDLSRNFFGSSGYGYVNGLEAPGVENGYLNYTVEAWFYQADTDGNTSIHDDATIMQFGGGPAIYVKSNTLRFRNGPFHEVISFSPYLDNKWYMVVARKTGNKLDFWLRASPTTPTGFQPWLKDGTGTSFYHPSGKPTFYIGYGEYAPWFRGAIDEVAFFRRSVDIVDIVDHFYADPAPENNLNLSPPVAAPASNPGSNFGENSANDTGSKPASKPSTSRAAKLKKAKAEVKRINGLVAKTKKWIGSLKHHNAPAKVVKRAQAKLKSLSKQLKRAKARVKSLS